MNKETKIHIKYKGEKGTLTLKYKNPFFIADRRFQGNPLINGVLYSVMSKPPLIGYFIGQASRDNYEGVLQGLRDCTRKFEGFEFTIEDAPDLSKYIKMEDKEVDY